ncbi:MAG: xanthine dehydrogenase family protein subunit M [Chloroflexi bacterium]|nr:xanthine dehydrogenase family protein subunit M [Chloroflexota bacterium]
MIGAIVVRYIRRHCSTVSRYTPAQPCPEGASVRPFDLLQPATVDEAVALLAQHGEDARLLGGGAMLTILLRQRLVAPRYLINVADIPGLNAISSDHNTLRLGAASTLRAIERSDTIRARCPVLAEALRSVGNIRVRNVATIGGHLAHADVHLDLPPVLCALGASVVVLGRHGDRHFSLDELFVGYYETCLAPTEMIAAVDVPTPPPGLQGVYLKYCSLSPNDWPTVGVAAFLRADGERIAEARIVVGSVSPRPLRLTEAEDLLRGERLNSGAVAEVARRYGRAADPLPDIRGSEDYKRRVTEVYVRRAVEAAATRAGLA